MQRSKSSNPTTTENVKDIQEQPHKQAIDGGKDAEKDEYVYHDNLNIIFLISIYTLQGIILGLFPSISFLLQSISADYGKQAIFSLCQWPAALKLFWAPLVDSVFSKKFGRRKSWLVPSFCILSCFMLYTSTWIDQLLHSSADFDVWKLTYVFFGIYFLGATQDICIDGWAVTILSPENSSKAPICSHVGQTLGYLLSFAVFMILQNVDYCNQFFRSEESFSTDPILTLGSFLFYLGCLFLFAATCICVLKSEPLHKFDRNVGSLTAAYVQMKNVLQIKHVQWLAVFFLTARIAFGCTDTVTGLKLQEYGVPKENVALLSILTIPLSLFTPLFMGKFESKHPMLTFMNVYKFRILVSFLIICFVAYVQFYLRDSMKATGSVPLSVSFGLLLQMSVGSVIFALMAVAQSKYFYTISDPSIGGTYMTLLNTMGSLSLTLSSLVNLQLVGVYEDYFHQDGFIPVSLFTVLVFGILWYVFEKRRVDHVIKLPATAWHCKSE